MKTIRCDITDEEYEELKLNTHFGEVSFILRRALHEYLTKTRALRGGGKSEVATRDEGTKSSSGRGPKESKTNTSR